MARGAFGWLVLLGIAVSFVGMSSASTERGLSPTEWIGLGVTIVIVGTTILARIDRVRLAGSLEAARCGLATGKADQAESGLRELAAACEEAGEGGGLELAFALFRLGSLLTAVGKLHEAEPHLARSVLLLERALAEDDRSPSFRWEVAYSLDQYAHLLRRLFRNPEAMRLEERAVALRTGGSAGKPAAPPVVVRAAEPDEPKYW